jgi:hypothetical protein
MRAIVIALVAAGCTHHPLSLEPPPGDDAGVAADLAPVDGTLRFAVFGDVRPGNPDDTANYPEAIVAGIFKLAAAKGAQFVVGTGDYMFASSQASVDAQMALLLEAEANFSGPIYHTLGNHECTGATASNCPGGNETANIRAFMSKLVPSGTTTPYYRVDVATPLGAAKFVFVAANAWSDAQATWLQTQLADPTTYTFVVRHESPSITETPGVTPSETMISAAPFTLELLGHSHLYERIDTQRVISGNGGAPLAHRRGTYGFLLVEQQADGNISVTEIEQATGNATDTWKVTPAGQAAD